MTSLHGPLLRSPDMGEDSEGPDGGESIHDQFQT